jgi:hypothetical protein
VNRRGRNQSVQLATRGVWYLVWYAERQAQRSGRKWMRSAQSSETLHVATNTRSSTTSRMASRWWTAMTPGMGWWSRVRSMVLRHGRDIMCQNDARCFSGPGKDRFVGSATEACVSNAGDVDLGQAST